MTRPRAAGRRALLALAIGLLSIAVAAPLASAGVAGGDVVLQDDGAVESSPDETVAVDELDGDTYWVGETLAVDGFQADETVTFSQEDGFRQYSADADGAVRVETDDWPTGTWSVTGEDSAASGSLTLRAQELHEATVEPTAAAEGATLVLDSNRAGYDVAVDATGLTAADLEAVFDDGWTSDGQFYLSPEENGGEYAFDAAALHAGDYQFELAVTDAAAEATATVNVTSPLRIGEHEPRSPEDVEGLYLDVDGDGSVGQGDVATFFQRQHRSAWKRPALFDFSGNGRVTHGDVVVLFDYVATGQLPVEEEVRFVDPVSEEAGDVADVELDVSSAGSNAYVTIHSGVVEGAIVVPLHSFQGDTATLQVNTVNLSDQSATTFTAENADVGTVEYARSPENETVWLGDLGQAWPGGYDFTLKAYSQDPTDWDVRADDRVRFSLEERSTDDLTTYVAPSDTLEGSVENASDLLADATESDAVTREDALLVEVEASGLYSYMQADASSYNDTAGGVGDLAFTFATEEETPVGTQERTVDLADLDGAELVVDEREDRFVVAVPAGEIEFSDYAGEFGAGDSVDVSFEVGPNNPYVPSDERERVTDSVAIEPAIEFVDGPYAEHEGDVAEIPVAVDSADGTADEAWVTATAVDHDYAATVRLEDVDGETTIAANAFLLGHGEAEGAFSGADVVGFAETGAFADLAADERFQDGAEFHLEAHATDPSDGTSADDEAELALEERSTDDLTTYVAPGDVDLTDAEEPSDLLEHATPRDRIAEGDVLIAEVEASGAYGSLDETTGFASHEGAAFTVTHERVDALGNVQEHTADLGNLSQAALVVDKADDRFLVAMRPSGLTLDGHDVEPRDSIDVTFEMTADSPYVSDGTNDSVTSTVDLEELEVEIAGDVDENGRLEVSNAEDAEIVARTNAAPGTEGDIYVLLQDATDDSGDITVDENGELVGEFDFSTREHGELIQAIEATVFSGAGAESAETSGVFVQDGASFSVNGSAPSQVDVGENASLDTTLENEGPVADDTTLSVSIDHNLVAYVPVELDAGDARRKSYEIPTDEPGEVTWEIEADGTSHSGTVTVEEPAS